MEASDEGGAAGGGDSTAARADGSSKAKAKKSKKARQKANRKQRQQQEAAEHAKKDMEGKSHASENAGRGQLSSIGASTAPIAAPAGRLRRDGRGRARPRCWCTRALDVASGSGTTHRPRPSCSTGSSVIGAMSRRCATKTLLTTL